MSDEITKYYGAHKFNEQIPPIEERLAYAENQNRLHEEYQQKLHQKLNKLIEKVDDLEKLNDDLTRENQSFKLPILGVVNTNDKEFICR